MVRFGCVPMDGEVLCPAGLRFKVRYGDVVPLLHRNLQRIVFFQAVEVSNVFGKIFCVENLGFGFNVHVLLLFSRSCDQMLRGQWTFRHHKDII